MFDPTLEGCISLNDCLSGANNTATPNTCTFCNYNKDLFVVGNMTTAGNCCKKGTVYLAHGMCE